MQPLLNVSASAIAQQWTHKQSCSASARQWAGKTRTDNRGPGGKVEVSFTKVREELRKLGGDFAMWVDDAGADPDLEVLATILADTHHRFQWIHPFPDGNGRVGRILNILLLLSEKPCCADAQGVSLF